LHKFDSLEGACAGGCSSMPGLLPPPAGDSAASASRSQISAVCVFLVVPGTGDSFRWRHS
jgi:hypothetical protein